ncbi:hypothetical protein ACFWBF_28675 [Streptomyces sp. NPDC060028]|uniref:hypothetical protein n=1 Tax=Streptomyces sp. NPDC060028 TaxID=3347041 RepID=UPI00369142C0
MTKAPEDLIARALVPYGDRPDAPEAARLVEDLLTAGLQAGFRRHAVPEGEQPPALKAAVREWCDLVRTGPGAGGDWSHARALARVLRQLVDALPEQQSAGSP